ncbi:sensor histidine kinase [Sphingomonas sinipercae]|uniref:histidine kinase n=1 Tax=Sphingomonas sinipercae TaxID=2714944 RepID=A0A6G7ZQ78_9SPHN|nr:sensor histidine kinase [Sphingomonas sinipercae]QIL03056.1 sensor histidine kinase [Sphingomonas sinipercae]
MASTAERFARLSTPAKLLLILTAVLLPISLWLGWVAYSGFRNANDALREQSLERARVTARSIESLIARNALALRIAANGQVANQPDPCLRIRQSLSITPAIAQQFRINTDTGLPLCGVGDLGQTGPLPLIAPGDIRLSVAPRQDALVIHDGVIGGIATTILTPDEIRSATDESARELGALTIRDGVRQLSIVRPAEPSGEQQDWATSSWPVDGGPLVIEIQSRVPRVTVLDRVLILLPLLMWIIAALATWWLVTHLLIRPLRRLQRAVSSYNPGDPGLQLPSKVGPATEIQDLREAFAKAVSRIEESEHEMSAALDGQRRLVREVHHRVKNNLQVVASLLNIHGRNAKDLEVRAAYAAIGRRVGALAIVHRNHYAEMEENRGIALRPLLSELAAELRAGAPEQARKLSIDLTVDTLHCTQDAAVSVAFLVTEVVEYAMLNRPDQPVVVTLHRTSDTTARMTLSSPVLVPGADGDRENVQFERIIGGMAKQLRSNLEREPGRYSVDMPVFPPR